MIKWRGIVFRLHPLFVLLMLMSVITGYFAELLTLFVIVLIHELGHVVAARCFGWEVIRVELLPFGGVAETDDRGRSTAVQEMVVALAGPLQNAWLALFGLLMEHLGIWESGWGSYFAYANAMIGLFNLLPVLPLDGGKVMQALVSLWLPYYRTLTLCSLVSLVLAISLGAAVVVSAAVGGIDPNLLVIAAFLAYSNWYGYRQAGFRHMRFLMNRDPTLSRLIGKGTLAQPIVIYRHRTISEIARLFMRDKYHLIYVIDGNGRVEAVVPEQRLLHAYFQLNEPGSAVSDVFVLK